MLATFCARKGNCRMPSTIFRRHSSYLTKWAIGVRRHRLWRQLVTYCLNREISPVLTRCTNSHRLFSTRSEERRVTPLPSLKSGGYFDNRQRRIKHIGLILTPSPCKSRSEERRVG